LTVTSPRLAMVGEREREREREIFMFYIAPIDNCKMKWCIVKCFYLYVNRNLDTILIENKEFQMYGLPDECLQVKLFHHSITPLFNKDLWNTFKNISTLFKLVSFDTGVLHFKAIKPMAITVTKISVQKSFMLRGLKVL
jgi:hypothetical protein